MRPAWLLLAALLQSTPAPKSPASSTARTSTTATLCSSPAPNPQRDKKGSWYWNPIDAHAKAAARLAALSPDTGKPQCQSLVTE